MAELFELLKKDKWIMKVYAVEENYDGTPGGNSIVCIYRKEADAHEHVEKECERYEDGSINGHVFEFSVLDEFIKGRKYSTVSYQ